MEDEPTSPIRISSDDCDGEDDEELESSEVCILFKFSMLTFVLCIFFGKQKRGIHSYCYKTSLKHANPFLPAPTVEKGEKVSRKAKIIAISAITPHFVLSDKWRCRASSTPTSFLKMVAVFGLGTLYQEGTPFANRNIVQGQGR